MAYKQLALKLISNALTTDLKTSNRIPVDTGRLKKQSMYQAKNNSILAKADPISPGGKRYASYVHDNHPTKKKFFIKHAKSKNASIIVDKVIQKIADEIIGKE